MEELPTKNYNSLCRNCYKNILFMKCIPISGDINNITEDDYFEIIDNGHIMLDGYIYCNQHCQFRYAMNQSIDNSKCDILKSNIGLNGKI